MSAPSADLTNLTINYSSAPTFPRRRGMNERSLLWAQEEYEREQQQQQLNDNENEGDFRDDNAMKTTSSSSSSSSNNYYSNSNKNKNRTLMRSSKFDSYSDDDDDESDDNTMVDNTRSNFNIENNSAMSIINNIHNSHSENNKNMYSTMWLSSFSSPPTVSSPMVSLASSSSSSSSSSGSGIIRNNAIQNSQLTNNSPFLRNTSATTATTSSSSSSGTTNNTTFTAANAAFNTNTGFGSRNKTDYFLQANTNNNTNNNTNSTLSIMDNPRAVFGNYRISNTNEDMEEENESSLKKATPMFQSLTNKFSSSSNNSSSSTLSTTKDPLRSSRFSSSAFTSPIPQRANSLSLLVTPITTTSTPTTTATATATTPNNPINRLISVVSPVSAVSSSSSSSSSVSSYSSSSSNSASSLLSAFSSSSSSFSSMPVTDKLLFTGSYSTPNTPLNHSPPAAVSPISSNSSSPPNETETPSNTDNNNNNSDSTNNTTTTTTTTTNNNNDSNNNNNSTESPVPHSLASLSTNKKNRLSWPYFHSPSSQTLYAESNEDTRDASFDFHQQHLQRQKQQQHQQQEQEQQDQQQQQQQQNQQSSFGTVLLAAQQIAHTKLQGLSLNSPQISKEQAEALGSSSSSNNNSKAAGYFNHRKRTISEDEPDSMDDVIAGLSLNNSTCNSSIWVQYSKFPPEVTMDQVRNIIVDLFTAIGEISDFYLPLSGESVAFISFSTAEDAQKAVSIFASPPTHIHEELMNALSMRVHDGLVDDNLMYSNAFSMVSYITKVATATPRGLVLSKRARISPAETSNSSMGDSIHENSNNTSSIENNNNNNNNTNNNNSNNNTIDNDDQINDESANSTKTVSSNPPLSEYSLNLWHQQFSSPQSLLTVQQLSRMENMGIDISGFQVLLDS